MPKKKDEQVEAAAPAKTPTAATIKPAKKTKAAVKQAVEKAIDVEKSAEKAVKRAVRKSPAKKSPSTETSQSATGPDAVTSTEAAVAPGQTEGSMMIDVLFTLQAHTDAREVLLVGDFNGWSQAAHPMSRNGDAFEITVPLERDRRYRYKYLIDGHHWENDWNADEYVANDYGGDDSVRVV